MHGPINDKSPNNISEWQMGFNSTLKELIHTLDEFFFHISVFMYHPQGKTLCQFLKNQVPLLSSYTWFHFSVAVLS
jgi:hypothetical protein